MSNEFGGDFVSITDEDGNEFELELLDAMIHNGIFYHAFVPADEGDDKDLGIIILKSLEENGEELLSTLDTEEELEQVYALFMERLFEDEDDEDGD